VSIAYHFASIACDDIHEMFHVWVPAGYAANRGGLMPGGTTGTAPEPIQAVFEKHKRRRWT